ncbi:MAG TPA: VOC family protein [Chloroflexia bacterium]|nr:VOC family protein [Chloroflexia bacterium]
MEDKLNKPKLCGLHHLKLPVSDISRSRDWYCEVLGFKVDIEFVEEGRLRGVALTHPGIEFWLALREEPERVDALSGFDPVALAVSTLSELEKWVTHLDRLGIEHGQVQGGHVGWLMSLKDPDGLEMRLYTLERPN